MAIASRSTSTEMATPPDQGCSAGRRRPGQTAGHPVRPWRRGLNDHARGQAHPYASLGYAAPACRGGRPSRRSSASVAGNPVATHVTDEDGVAECRIHVFQRSPLSRHAAVPLPFDAR